MAGNGKGVVMYDNDYMAAATYIESYSSSLVGMINGYVNILARVTEGAIQDQKICAALANLANQTGALMEVISSVGEQAANASRSFISEVDSADSFLY